MRDAEDMKMVEDDLMDGVGAEQARLGSLFLKVFGTEAGSEVLSYIKTGLCGQGMSVFSTDELDMARKAGKLEVALAIDAILMAAKEMEKERPDNLQF